MMNGRKVGIQFQIYLKKLAFAVLTAYVCEILVQQMNTIRTEAETACWIIQVQQAYY